MRAFEELTYRGQVARMRALARIALPRWGLKRDAPLKLCGHGENTVFQVRDGRGRPYTLRIHRLDYQTPATIRSEMEWLAALDRDTDLHVQQPRQGRDGELVQRVAHAGVPGERSVVLMRWSDGRLAGLRRGPAYYRAVGELAGTLHAHGQTWKKPRGFTRRAWDEKELLLEPAFGDPFAAPGLRAKDREQFRAACDRVLRAVKRLGKSRRTWGLIHADLHCWNVLRHEGTLRPIDFDDCGTGWFVYDMMIAAASPVWATPAYEPTMEAFLEGYREVLAFEQDDLDYVQPFFVARNLDLVGWLVSRADNPSLRKLIPNAIQRTRKACRAYLKT